jgi:NADH-quinone oxidoreductase subunit L
MLTFFVTGSVSFFANPAAGEAAQTALSYFKSAPVEPFTLGAIFAGGATSVAMLLFIGATGKSAQIPLYVWLPDAMAGPTPVSALIHAATMVTAGVYMIVRCSEIFVHAPTVMFIVAIIGAVTAIFAATIGLAQNDIKKVLAYSTISQLGYMFLECGVGAFVAAIFHVITHAFFKALLFLGSGSVINGMHHEQDMRRMGGLRKYMPITFATMVAGWLAICGVPIFAGFFSKDEILWKTWSAAGLGSFNKVLWAIGAITALLTAIYMTRLMVMTFWGAERFRETRSGHTEHEERDDHHRPVEPHESPWLMTLPLIVLAILSTVGGFIGVPYALANRDINVIEHTLEPVVAKAPDTGPGISTEAATDLHGSEVNEERLLTVVSVVIALLGIGLGWVLFRRRPLLEMPRVLENKYYVDEIYDATLIGPIETVSREGLWKIIDVGVIDGLLHSIGEAVTELGRLGRWLQAGFVRGYAAIILTGALILIGLFAYFGFPR